MDTSSWAILQTVKPAVSSTTSITATLANTVLRSLIIVFIGGSGLTDTVSTITDNAGNVYTQACGTHAGSGGNSEIWYARNTQPTTSVIVTFSGSTNTKSVIVREYSGMSLSASVLDGTGVNSATATSGSNTGCVAAITGPTKTSTMFVATCSLVGASASLSVGLFDGDFDQITNASPVFAHGIEDLTPVGAGTASGTMFFTPANNSAYDMCMAAFEFRQGQAGTTVNIRPHSMNPGLAK